MTVLSSANVSYDCGQCEGQSSRGPHTQVQLLLPLIVKLHALRKGLGLDLHTHTHTERCADEGHVTVFSDVSNRTEKLTALWTRPKSLP